MIAAALLMNEKFEIGRIYRIFVEDYIIFKEYLRL